MLSGVAYNKHIDFVIDSGAERSVIPLSMVPDAVILPSSIQLSGVGGEKLVVYGHCSAEVQIKSLRRNFRVNFVVTDTCPILGADFLSSYNLSLNMKQKFLIDPIANIKAELKPGSFKHPTVRVASASSDDSFIKIHFPELTEPPDYNSMPVSGEIEHCIETNCSPIFSKPRPLNPAKYAIAEAEFNTLISMKIVRPSKSPWASPLHMVKKANGTWRPCGDYRRLNAATVPDRYSIPNMQHIHNKLHGAQIFSTLDLVKAYHFIPVAEKDIPKTAICTPFGTFEYLRMPFGLRNATSTFQRYVDNLFRDVPFVVTYIDDILIFSRSVDEHKAHLNVVLNKLRDAGLKVNDKKCHVLKSEVSFLGYLLTGKGIKPMKERVEALKELPPPSDKKTLQRYIGMFSFYQRCIPCFSEKIMPLRNILRKPDFVWSDCDQQCFDTLKTLIADATELTFPSPNASYTITADASDYAIGASLHQVYNGSSSPLSFFSRKLSPVESKYSTFDRELLAVFAATKKWKDFIEGSPVTVFTDHKPLLGALKGDKERHSGRQQRQISLINEYITDVIYVAGKDNVVADTLSRNENASIGAVDTSSSSFDLIGIAKGQVGEDFSDGNYKAFDIDKNFKVYCEISNANPRPFVPVNLRHDLFLFFHGLAHPGRKATTKMIGSRYFWPTLKTDCHRWVTECLECQENKVQRHTKRPIRELPCPSERFSTVHMDIVGPLEVPCSSASEVNSPRYLLTIIDSFTRWVEVVPLVTITAESVCQAFLLEWVARFGPPLVLVTDRGSQFNSELLSLIRLMLGINHIRTCAYNPKANGLVERFHRTLKASLKCRGKNWLDQLPIVMLGLRMRPDEDGTSAYSRVVGEQPLVPKILPGNFDLQELSKQLHQIQHRYTTTRSRSTPTYMPKDLQTCEFVWMRLDRVRKSLEAPYQGPYRVLSRKPDVYTLDIKGKPVTVSVERLKPAVLPAKRLDDTETGRTDGAHNEMTNRRDTDARSDDTHSEVSDSNQRTQMTDGAQETDVTRGGRRVRIKEKPDFVYY